ncbi:autotransporter-associated beta strand repeat-containing protein [Nitrosospira sp. Nsp11]|uniref:autotransporter-associated beta strand repeat-containing protein n=1 Tax=Nitrosospira sp. Nsp11 TaxID=1855338 RepID=UPI000922CC49|nr:autotransporter-associated beta strand repeat-containing protein [Nitrosospira sp. Nsp11]SHL71213.1 autotransporter-associated beta strand repeat-containing protein [Nitrosospira sp. Nsp11]
MTTVTHGTLRVDNANALGTSTAASDLVLNKNSTFFFNTDFTHDYTLMGNTVSVQGGEGATWNGSPTLTLSTIMNLNGANDTLSGNLSDTGAHVLSLTRNGTGRMTLSANNAYTGATTVTQGILQLGSANALSAGSNLAFNGEIGTGGSIELTSSSGDFTRNLDTGAGQVQWAGDGGFQSSGSNRVVDIGGAGAALAWGSGEFVPTGHRLILGASGNGMLDFQNGIEPRRGAPYDSGRGWRQQWSCSDQWCFIWRRRAERCRKRRVFIGIDRCQHLHGRHGFDFQHVIGELG